MFSTPLLGKERVPDLTDASFTADEVTKLRHHFSAGELTGIRVKVWLPRRKGPGQEGHLDVFIQRLRDGTRCDTYYVREGMTITKINSRATLRGVQAMVKLDAGPLAKLLGDTEGPAHEDWDTSFERPDQEWKTWKGRVKFVRGIVDNLVEIATPPTTEPDFDLLSDFFSIKHIGGSQRQRKSGDDVPKPSILEPIISEPKWFQISAHARRLGRLKNDRHGGALLSQG